MDDAQPIHEGQILTGALFNEPMRVETVRASGTDTWTVGLVGIPSEQFRKVTLNCLDIKALTIFDSKFSYQGNGVLMSVATSASKGLLSRARIVVMRHSNKAQGAGTKGNTTRGLI